MQVRDLRSIIVIFLYVILNAAIMTTSLLHQPEKEVIQTKRTSLAPDFSEVEDLDYFFSKDGIPQMSLTAMKMRSVGEEKADFDFPRGVYNYLEKKQTFKYSADFATYKKQIDYLVLKKNAKVTSEEGQYQADQIEYFLKKDLVLGEGHVKFEGDDLNSHDHIIINSEKMRAHPQNKYGLFTVNVDGSFQRNKKYEGKLFFWAQSLEFKGQESFAHLEDNVKITRDNYVITGGKADIYLGNFNKTLKYFVFNDDVRVEETLNSPTGVVQRRTFSERLEGFGQEERMVLSGAPRVETGSDVIRGYRITIRQKVDLVEVDDAVSDMSMKKKEAKKE